MSIIYIDASSGASGDMLLGALLDVGLPETALREALARMPVEGYRLDIRREMRGGLAATRADVRLLDEHDHEHEHPHGDHGEPGHSHAAEHAGHGHDHPHGGHEHEPHGGDPEESAHHKHGDALHHSHPHDAAHHAGYHDDSSHAGHHADGSRHEAGGHHHARSRHLPEILEIIAGANLPGRAAEWASAVFRRLADAEAKVHGTTPDNIHFHEVGAVDAIVDIVGVCSGLALLGHPRVIVSPLPMGSGFVQCAHGRLPVPAPAVIELARGIPVAASMEPGELTTPTGAALLVTLAERFGPMPAMVPEAIGYGAGSRQGKTAPNVLRAVLGREPSGADDAAEADSVWVIEANLDDATGETLGATTRALLDAGALDAWLAPVTMKKGRPGVILGCLADEVRRAAIEDVIFRQTTTFGIRRTRAERTKLDRRHVEVATPFGPVRIKVGSRAGKIVTALPEYEDCLRLAQERGIAFREVYDAARAAYGAGA
jgi:pyridinium-3,5-bisthiocarboxylic acid mononucleotide nickel chelatase